MILIFFVILHYNSKIISETLTIAVGFDNCNIGGVWAWIEI